MYLPPGEESGSVSGEGAGALEGEGHWRGRSTGGGGTGGGALEGGGHWRGRGTGGGALEGGTGGGRGHWRGGHWRGGTGGGALEGGGHWRGGTGALEGGHWRGAGALEGGYISYVTPLWSRRSRRGLLDLLFVYITILQGGPLVKWSYRVFGQ